MLHNYFRHYKLYKAIFTKRRSDVFSQAAPFAVEAPREPLPLSSFLPLRVEVDMPEDAPAPAPGPAPAPAAALAHVRGIERRVRVPARRADARGGRRGRASWLMQQAARPAAEFKPRHAARSGAVPDGARPADLRTSPVRPRIRVDARRAARLERFCELGLGGRL